MKRITWTVAIAAAVGVASASQIAYAAVPCPRDFALAKVKHQAETSIPITGLGTVTLQVLVNADGTHQVQKVIKSTNKGDNDAATDIANASTYTPAVCGTTPQTSFYDYVLKFKGSTAETAGLTASGLSPADVNIQTLTRSGKYAAGSAAAQAQLAKSPNDQNAQEFLGINAYYLNDMAGSAEAFSKVRAVGPNFRAIAAQSLAAAAVKLSSTDQPTALAYANKAMSISPNVNSKYALGVAQLGNPATAPAGIATLESLRSKVIPDAAVKKDLKIVIDDRLLNAYLAQGDMTHATALSTEMNSVDPSSGVAAQAMGGHFIQQAYAQMNNKNFTAAVPLFDQAATYDDKGVRVTAYTQAALALVNTTKDSDLPIAQGYTQKALALAPDDAEANFIAGVVATFIWTGSHKDADKTQAINYLTTADANAKKASDAKLASQVEDFQAAHFPAIPSH